VREAVRVYESLGATVKQLSLPHGKYAVALTTSSPLRGLQQSGPYDGVHYGYRPTSGKSPPNWTPAEGIGAGRRRAALEELDIRWCGCIAAAGPRVSAESEATHHAGRYASAPATTSYYKKPGVRRLIGRISTGRLPRSI